MIIHAHNLFGTKTQAFATIRNPIASSHTNVFKFNTRAQRCNCDESIADGHKSETIWNASNNSRRVFLRLDGKARNSIIVRYRMRSRHMPCKSESVSHQGHGTHTDGERTQAVISATTLSSARIIELHLAPLTEALQQTDT